MKDTLDEESRQALIKYRMERAYDSIIVKLCRKDVGCVV